MKVLHVEDDDIDADILRSMASHVRGVQVERVASGATAISLLRSRSYDLIVLDWTLPGVSGPEILAAIREQPRLAQVPVVVWTAHIDGVSVREAYRRGCNAVVQKAMGLAESESDVLRMLRHYAAVTPVVLAAD